MLLPHADAKSHCRLCEHIFLVNQHLLVSTNQHVDEQDDHKLQTSGVQPAQDNRTYQQKNNTVDEDILIHDDMEIDDDNEVTDTISADYDDLDAMQAWLTDNETNNVNHTRNDSSPHPNTSTPSSTVHQNSQPNPNRLISDTTSNNDLKPSDQINLKNTRTSTNTNARVIKSPQTYDSATKNEDNWLEKLLEEKSESTQANAVDNDLAQRLATVSIEPKARVVMTPETMQTSIASLLWLAGCMVLVLLLLAQYVTFNLDTLIKDPDHASRLQSICAIAACSLPHAELSAFEIDSIDTRASQIQSASKFSDITATLVNQGTQAQLFPSLKVSIYDADDVVGEFIADPTEYLLSPQRQLAAQYRQPVLFTIPLAASQIHHVIITPIY